MAEVSSSGRRDHADREFRDLVENASDVVVGFEADGQITYVNQTVEHLLGWDRYAVIGQSIADFVHPDDLGRAVEIISVYAGDEEGDVPITPARFRVKHQSGTWLPIEFTGPRLQGSSLGKLVIIGRYSADNDLHDQLLECLTAGRSTREVVELIPEFGRWRHPTERYAVILTDDDGSRLCVGDALDPILLGMERRAESSPFSRAAATNRTNRAGLVDLDEVTRDAATAAGLVGVWIEPVPDPANSSPAFAVGWSSDAGFDPGIHRYPLEIMARDLELVLQWRHRLAQLEYAALHDQLTGVGNRELFFGLLDTDEHPYDAGAAILYIDLDGFKPINDEFGHRVGDQVLVEVAERIRRAVRPADHVARIGGDEFAVLCHEVDEADAGGIAQRLLDELDSSVLTAAGAVKVGVSIGIALTNDAAGEWLLDAADRVLYRAKKEEKGSWRLAHAGQPA